MTGRVFPLSAIVGQEELVDALLVNAVAPEVGGVLVRGERGTAKSTAVRALAPLLPPVRAAVGEPFCFAPGEAAPGGVVAADAVVEDRAAPLVELPVGASVDRLLGALDLARALRHREHAFEPGLLARAHRGVLYVDEVNLLPDHLVDVLLDAAASGVCVVERDAVSVHHAARFLLVGTMNAEEGDLRPQLLDRFGLGVEVRAPTDPAVRAEIVRRRMAFDREPGAFCASWAPAEAELAARIAAARALLHAVRMPERELLRVTGACAKLGIDGVRGDLVCVKAARALAALGGREEVEPEDVRRAAALALAHRRRRDPLDPGAGGADAELDDALDLDPDPDPEPPAGPADPPSGGSLPADPPPNRDGVPATASGERMEAPAEHLRAPIRDLALRGTGRGAQGRTARACGGAAIDAVPGTDDLAPLATIRARLADDDAAARSHVRAGREGVLLVLVVDASGSMGARRRMAATKGALLALLRDAYARRDRVALIAFRDARAEVVCAPGATLSAVAAAVRTLPTGGRTPLAEGLDAAAAAIAAERRRHPGRRAGALVLTDGRADRAHEAARRLAATADEVLVVDTEDGPVRLARAAELAAEAGARLVPLTPKTTRRRAA